MGRERRCVSHGVGPPPDSGDPRGPSTPRMLRCECPEIVTVLPHHLARSRSHTLAWAEGRTFRRPSGRYKRPRGRSTAIHAAARRASACEKWDNRTQALRQRRPPVATSSLAVGAPVPLREHPRLERAVVAATHTANVHRVVADLIGGGARWGGKREWASRTYRRRTRSWAGGSSGAPSAPGECLMPTA